MIKIQLGCMLDALGPVSWLCIIPEAKNLLAEAGNSALTTSVLHGLAGHFG